MSLRQKMYIICRHEPYGPLFSKHGTSSDCIEEYKLSPRAAVLRCFL